MQKLKVGDYVKDILTGKVGEVSLNCSAIHTLMALGESFSTEGYACSHHTVPRFIKVEPPKKMVTKTMHKYANIFEDGGVCLYEDKKVAERFSSSYHAVKAVPVTITYEVEE